jgi:hypothetical protein
MDRISCNIHVDNAISANAVVLLYIIINIPFSSKTVLCREGSAFSIVQFEVGIGGNIWTVLDDKPSIMMSE